MKLFAKSLLAFFESIGRAKAAQYFVSIRRYDLARAVMLKD